MRKRLIEPEKLLWRTGRHVHRTVYAVVGSMPGDTDMLIGLMDTRALAEAAVKGHNLQMVMKVGTRQPTENP
jgi:hypothetical protein